jgi:predicted acyltransferase (DUF342 family)
VSFNQKLKVSGDVSFGSGLTVTGRSTFNNDISLNRYLFVGNDVSLNSKLYVKGDVSFGSGLYVNSTAISSSTSSGAVVVKGGVGVAGNLVVGGTVNLESGGVTVSGLTRGGLAMNTMDWSANTMGNWDISNNIYYHTSITGTDSQLTSYSADGTLFGSTITLSSKMVFGYFRSLSTANYRIKISFKAGAKSLFWFGSDAGNDYYTYANSLLKLDTTVGSSDISGYTTISFSAGVKYPFRILYANTSAAYTSEFSIGYSTTTANNNGPFSPFDFSQFYYFPFPGYSSPDGEIRCSGEINSSGQLNVGLIKGGLAYNVIDGSADEISNLLISAHTGLTGTNAVHEKYNSYERFFWINDDDYRSVMMAGYFSPPADASYNFHFSSGTLNNFYLWFGKNAINGLYTTSNNSPLTSINTLYSAGYLMAGKKYPLRFWFKNLAQAGAFFIQYSTSINSVRTHFDFSQFYYSPFPEYSPSPDVAKLNVFGGQSVDDLYVSRNLLLTTGGDLTVQAGDVSFNGGLTVTGRSTFNNDISLNRYLFVGNDVSLNSRLYVGSDVSLNAKLYVNGDVSFGSGLTVTGRSTFNNDISLNRYLFVGNDVSLNTRLYVGGDVSLNTKLYVNGDVSFGSGLTVTNRSTFNNDISLSRYLFVGNDVSLNTRLYVGGDVSFNQKLKVSGDVSFNAGLTVKGVSDFSGVTIKSVLKLEGGPVTDDVNVESSNKTNTYIRFGAAGSADDWVYLRQIGTSDNIQLALDFHDNSGDAGFVIRDISSAGNGADSSFNERFKVKRGGGVVINGTLDVNGGAVTVIGDVTATSFNATSDYRMKENVEKLSFAECSVENLNPVSYILKTNKQPHIGFLAHELQEYFPTAVSGVKDGEAMQTVNYLELIPVLVKEIQELKKKVLFLENDIDYLKQELSGF